jgi:hypothetical protein
MSTLSRFGLLPVVVLAAALLAAQPAFTSDDDGGGGGTRSLMNEDFLAQDVTVTADCDPDDVSTVQFSASGIATPPYPGPFFVSGTVKIGPQEFDGAFPGTLAGPVLSLSEGFVVFSPLATVFGSKRLPEGLDPSVSQGTCMEVTDFPIDSLVGSGTVVVVSTQPRYDATIREPLGTFRDRGDALLSFTEIDLDVGRIAGFDQFFLQSDSAPPPGDDDDD